MNHIDEFLSPNFHGVAQQCFVAILLITIVALAVARNKPSLSRVLVLLFATYSGLYASRSLPVSSLLLTLIVAPLWTQAIAEAARQSRSLLAAASLPFPMAVDLPRAWGGLNWASAAIVWPLAAILLGLLVCVHHGKIGATQWMNAHFDPNTCRCRPRMRSCNAAFTSRSLHPTPGADT